MVLLLNVFVSIVTSEQKKWPALRRDRNSGMWLDKSQVTLLVVLDGRARRKRMELDFEVGTG
eukprot:507179-Pyramimonas_sp.AAC.1